MSSVLSIFLSVGFKISSAKPKSIDISGLVSRARLTILAKLWYYPTASISLVGIFLARIVIFFLFLDLRNSCLIILS
jgi:hypothetical protein